MEIPIKRADSQFGRNAHDPIVCRVGKNQTLELHGNLLIWVRNGVHAFYSIAGMTIKARSINGVLAYDYGSLSTALVGGLVAGATISLLVSLPFLWVGATLRASEWVFSGIVLVSLMSTVILDWHFMYRKPVTLLGRESAWLRLKFPHTSGANPSLDALFDALELRAKMANPLMQPLDAGVLSLGRSKKFNTIALLIVSVLSLMAGHLLLYAFAQSPNADRQGIVRLIGGGVAVLNGYGIPIYLYVRHIRTPHRVRLINEAFCDGNIPALRSQIPPANADCSTDTLRENLAFSLCMREFKSAAEILKRLEGTSPNGTAGLDISTTCSVETLEILDELANG